MKNKITKLFLALLALAGFNASAQATKSSIDSSEPMPEYVRKATNIEFLTNFAAEKKAEFDINYAKAIEEARKQNKEISGTIDGYSYSLVGIEGDTGGLIYYRTTNNSPTKSSLQTANAKPLHALGVAGAGMNVAVWDGGAGLPGHSAFLGGRYLIKDNGNNVPQIDQNSKEHAAHVAGTVAGAAFGDGTTKGFAYEAKVFAYNWFSDVSEMASAAANTLTPIYTSNHSYGIDAIKYIQSNGSISIFGQYNGSAREYDVIANNAPYYTIVFAAGNDRDSYSFVQPTKGGRDLLSQAGVSKNVVVVAATKGTEDFTGITGTSSVSGSNAFIAGFSNYGPTDDFRIKPDIAAKGVDVKSISNLNINATETMDGTSMAAPAVTGVFTLWQNYFKQIFDQYMLSSTVRALMAHSAREVGEAEGPDYKFGWGLIDADAGAKVMRDKTQGKAVIAELDMTQGQSLEYSFTYDGQQPLIATIAWNDPAGSALNTNNSNIPSLINDLDIKVVNEDSGQEFLPWALNHSWSSTGGNIASRKINSRDNIERINVNSTVAGAYKVVVTHKGNLKDGAVQKFSLIISGAGDDMPAIGELSISDHIFTELSIFPNPTKNVLNVKGNDEELMGALIDVYDIGGKKVLHKKINSNEIQIDVESLSNGIYLLDISNNEKRQVLKFVKQ